MLPSITLTVEGLPDPDKIPGGVVYGGIESDGGPSAYSQVWEWGNTRQTRKGPHTTYGVAPDGRRIWLSTQAPFGYVRLNEPNFAAAIERRMTEQEPDDDRLQEQVVSAAKAASQDIAAIVRATAPVDTGALMDSIRAVDPSDSGLADVDQWSDGSGHALFGE